MFLPHPLLRKRETETATVSYSELLFDLDLCFLGHATFTLSAS